MLLYDVVDGTVCAVSRVYIFLSTIWAAGCYKNVDESVQVLPMTSGYSHRSAIAGV